MNSRRMYGRKMIGLEQRWELMQKGITKLRNLLEGLPETPFSAEEYMTLYTAVYDMCTRHKYSQQLYDRYRESIEEYITSMVLPSLREKHDEFMLRELVKREANHKVMVRRLSHFFYYLDRCFTTQRSLPTINEVGLTCFRDLVYKELYAKARDAVISLIDQEREGEQIDQVLLKNALDIFVGSGMGKMTDFEASLLKDTAAYYSQKASKWILEDSFTDYMLKVEECLKHERDTVSHYLHPSSKLKLLESVGQKLFSVYANQLLEHGQTGYHAFLSNNKKNLLEGLPQTQFSLEDYRMLSTTICNMCTQKCPHDYTKQLYDKCRESFEKHINMVVLPSLREKHDDFMLRELVKRWENHNVMIQWFSPFFHCVDQYFIAPRSLPPLKEVGLTCFRDLVYRGLFAKVTGAVISLIDQEREGEQIDRALLKNILDIFVESGMGKMNCYESDFEASLLKDTAAYYSRKASKWILEDSFTDYMLKVEEGLKHERDTVAHYLFSSSELKLLECVGHNLVSVYANQLLENEHAGYHAFLRDNKVEDLLRMVCRFSKIPGGLIPAASIFNQLVAAESTALVGQAADAASNKKAQKEDAVGLQAQVFVWKLIELDDKYLAYVKDCLENRTLFHKARKEAFEVFCNKGVSGRSSAELLATFCDNMLKKGGSEKWSDEAIEETLEKVVKLLSYISDKDLFFEFYRKKLARRLLFNKSANDDHERSILTKLKQQCGGQFTSRMEGMVTDLTLERENQTSFEEYLSNNPNAYPRIDFSVTVLTTGFWPSYKSFDLNLLAEMLRCVQVFKEFYQTKTKHRKLTWIHSLGTCNIIGKFEPKNMELIVTTSQACALLLFNTSERLSYSEIMNQLNLNDDDAVRLLHSLSCTKYKILTKEPKTRTILRTDHFEFNAKFTNKMTRIKIPLPPVDERKKVIEDVYQDRRYAIDASIVRIMKGRKVLRHQQLVMECVEQLGRMFKPDVRAIKKRIEDLIARDYLERDRDDPSLFKYLA